MTEHAQASFYRRQQLEEGAMSLLACLLLVSLLLPMQSFAEGKTSAKACATRDALFLLQLEEYGEKADVPGERLYAAFLTMLRARAACSRGRTEDGLALYDDPFGPAPASATAN
jgi:hypothetical protein